MRFLGGWGGGRGGASIRQGAFIREGRLIQTIHLKGGHLLDTGRLFESGRLLDHLRYCSEEVRIVSHDAIFYAHDVISKLSWISS